MSHRISCRRRGSEPWGRLAAVALGFAVLALAAPADAAPRDAQEAEIQYSRGLLALNAGDAHEAVQRFEAAHARDPGDARYLLYLGLAENRLRRYRKADDHLSQAESMDAGLPALPYERGITAMGLEDWEAALRRFEEARRRQPRRGEVYLRLGVAQDRLGRHSEALSNYEKAVSLDPALADQAAFYRGRTYLHAGMVDRAREEFSSAAGSGDDRIVGLSEDYLGRIEVAEAGPPDRWDFTGYLAAVYDDNVILNPEDPGIDFEVTDQEDVRAVAYGAVRYRPWMGRKGMLGLGLGLYQSLHEDLDAYDLTGILPEITFQWRCGAFQIRSTASYSDYELDGDDYLQEAAVEVRPGWREGNSGRTDLVLRYGDEDYDFDERDAEEWAFGVEQFFYPWRTKRRYFSLRLEYADHDAGRDFERVERQVGGAFYTPLGDSWDFTAALYFTTYDYENVHSFFETIREDDEWRAVLRMTYDFNAWLALVMEYRGTEHRSNIPFFDYDRQTVTLGILARP